jgi:hypothetical protein
MLGFSLLIGVLMLLSKTYVPVCIVDYNDPPLLPHHSFQCVVESTPRGKIK